MNTSRHCVSMFPSSSFQFDRNHQQFKEDGATTLIFSANTNGSLMMMNDEDEFHREFSFYSDCVDLSLNLIQPEKYNHFGYS
jgi:hypothetical protein